MDFQSKPQSKQPAERAAIVVLGAVLTVIALAVTSVVVAVAVLAVSEIWKHV